MAQRLFAKGIGAVGYTVTPTANHNKSLIANAFSAGSNGNSVVLAAGESAFSYALNGRFATALPNFTGTAVGSYKIGIGFQSTNPTNVYTKVRVHRATLSGIEYTIASSSQWSEERLTEKANQRWEFTIDQVNLGTWASTNALIVEYNYRNAGASSVTPQPTGGGYYRNAVYTPFETSAAFGYTTQLAVGQRPYIYSQGGIRGTNRYLIAIVNTSASTGTATGTQGGTPEPIFPAWWLDWQPPKKKEKVQAESGRTLSPRIYAFGFAYGTPGFTGEAMGNTPNRHMQLVGIRSAAGIVWGRQTIMALKPIDGHAHLRTAEHDLLVMIGEL